MQYSESFRNALSEGHTLIRRVWQSASNPKKLSVQLIQEIDVTVNSDLDPALIWANSGSSGRIGKNLVTVIVPMLKERAAEAGLSIGDYFDTEEVIFASDVFPMPVCIELVETNDPNPLLKDHQPVVNPSTGEIVTSNGKPIYRHTFLASGSYVEPELLPRDRKSRTVTTIGSHSEAL